MAAPRDLKLEDWAIVPGPESIHPPFDSLGDHEIAMYEPEDVSRVVLSYAEMNLTHGPDPDFWHWLGTWKDSYNQIELNMTLFDTEPPMWGGFDLSGSATPDALIRMYEHIRTRFPAVWLHDAYDCGLHDSASFRKKFTEQS